MTWYHLYLLGFPNAADCCALIRCILNPSPANLNIERSTPLSSEVMAVDDRAQNINIVVAPIFRQMEENENYDPEIMYVVASIKDKITSCSPIEQNLVEIPISPVFSPIRDECYTPEEPESPVFSLHSKKITRPSEQNLLRYIGNSSSEELNKKVQHVKAIEVTMPIAVAHSIRQVQVISDNASQTASRNSSWDDYRLSPRFSTWNFRSPL